MARCPSQGDTCPSPSQGKLSSCPSQDYFSKAMLLVLVQDSSMVTGPRQSYLSKVGRPRQLVNLAQTKLLAQGILSKAACQLVQVTAACQGLLVVESCVPSYRLSWDVYTIPDLWRE